MKKDILDNNNDISILVSNELGNIFNVVMNTNQIRYIVSHHIRSIISGNTDSNTYSYILSLMDCLDVDSFFASHISKHVHLYDNTIFNTRQSYDDSHITSLIHTFIS